MPFADSAREKAKLRSTVVCSVNRKGTIVECSNGAQEQWGYTSAELIGKLFNDFIHDGDISEALSNLRHGSIDPAIATIECLWRKKDRSLARTLWSVQYDDKKQLFTCIAHDLTRYEYIGSSLHRGKQRVRKFFETLPVGVLIVAKDGIVEAHNPSAACLFEIGDNFSAHISVLLQPGSTQVRDDDLMDLIVNSIGKTQRFSGIKSSGKAFPVEISVERLTLEDLDQLLVVVIDITQKYELEKRKQEYLNMINHDLRTPLNSVMAGLELIEVGFSADMTKQALDELGRVQRNALKVLNMINELLEIERIESTALTLSLCPISSLTVIYRAVESVQSTAQQKNISIIIPETGVPVEADSELLERVITNLLSNALKFSPEGSLVQVASAQDNGRVVITISDRGRGIPPNKIETVFEKFRQVSESDRQDKHGFGLGLAICKAIVEAHGGTIGVRSTVGEGSEFWFCIPSVASGRSDT